MRQSVFNEGHCLFLFILKDIGLGISGSVFYCYPPACSGAFMEGVTLEADSWMTWHMQTDAYTHTHSFSSHICPLTQTITPNQLSRVRLSLSSAQGSFFFLRALMNISSVHFVANNISVPTRYAAPPYHFQLDEHGVTAGLVENLNTMHEMENRAGDREWTLEWWRVGG